MDYVVGSVAALISGNVTPNRPRLVKRALTPTKHQASPNVTPKSEFVDDKSIFLSPSLQRKKAVVKKSPKRIFENQNLDVTNDGEGNSSLTSPKADKVKKHLKSDLEAEDMAKISAVSPKSPKSGKAKLNKSAESVSPKKKSKINTEDSIASENIQASNENTPKKKKKQQNSVSNGFEVSQSDKVNSTAEKAGSVISVANKSPKKKRKLISESEMAQNEETQVDTQAENSVINENGQNSPKKKKKRNKKPKQNANAPVNSEVTEKDNITATGISTDNQQKPKKKNKKRKNKNKAKNNEVAKGDDIEPNQTEESASDQEKSPEKKKKKGIVNPNAITNEDSDSEHESDDDIESETEEENNKVLNTEQPEESSDEEEEVKQQKPVKRELTAKEREDEIKTTLFVGNVPFSAKCKKEIKKIFNKYGPIETIRIRNVPVKDARVTPKMAVIKNELHPERSTVNVYIKFANEVSVAEALAENNTVLNDYRLRVTRSDTTGADHDPRCAIFVGNLPFSLEDNALYDVFEKCGEIDSVRIVRDKKTNAGKGFGFVNFKSKDAVELALELSEEDLTVKNKIIRVQRCTQRPQKPGRFENTERHQGNRGNFQGRNQNNQGRPQNFQGRNQRGSFRGRNQGGNFQGRSQGFGRQGQSEGKEDGAYRRIMNKRPNQETGDGPPNKRPNLNEPVKEKKARKEFVGMTAEKKKKQKFNKGQKKKKALSEILTK